MKHIKTYKIFESIEDIKGTLTDICCDITDDGDFEININTNVSDALKGYFDFKGFYRMGDMAYIQIGKPNMDHSIGLDKNDKLLYMVNDIDDVVNRIKTFLGDRFIQENGIKYRGGINVLYGSDVRSDKVSSFVIWFKK